jgi:DNA-binding CsgD family transcriptional regulator
MVISPSFRRSWPLPARCGEIDGTPVARSDHDDRARSVRVSEIVIGGERLVVLSHALDLPAGSSVRDELTPAEAEVARLACAGLTNAEIAARRGASVRTIANQIAAVLRKTGATSRRELAARWAAREE